MNEPYEQPGYLDVGARLESRPMPSDQRAAPPLELEQEQPPRRMMPLLLFLLTCYTTYQVGGLVYTASLLFILGSHEMGHWLQARRYRVPASLPWFIPMPVGPIGTMGAVISMGGNMGNRRTLFDIGISGPLAGLGPALICSIAGLYWATIVPIQPGQPHLNIGEPLLFKGLEYLIIGETPPGTDIMLHPIGFAGWVGIFITALNLFPIGQLDGGHVLYALLLRKAHLLATLLLVGVFALVVLTGQAGWLPMIVLLLLIGPNHPPTGDDNIPLGTGRTILGWVTLAFVLIGFTPTPFYQG